MKKHIFTIMAGCAPVGLQMLKSYFKFHDEKIHIYIFSSDIELLPINGMNFTPHILPDSLKESFSRGHEGTAKIWQRVIKDNPDSYLIQIDSDIIFKKESLSLIEKAGYPDIYGSRRCYQNNPGKAPVKEGLEDAISTYFIGLNPEKLHNSVPHESLGLPPDKVLADMIQGTYNPLGFPCLDFFDPVFFWMRYKGATVYYEDTDKIGGQTIEGLKNNSYPSNLHMDMGSHLCHFGGAGSGYAACVDDSKMNKDYSDWAKFRWFLFEDLFYPTKLRLGVSEIMYNHFPEQTIIKEDGRWVAGPYNEEIFNQIKQDLNN